MVIEPLVCVFRSTERPRVEALAEELQRVGIVAVFLPSDRVIGMWTVEVPASDEARAEMAVVGLPGYQPLD
jgi:hypothetical protein